MNREESQKIIMTLRLNFENFHPKLSSEEYSLLINQWEFQFKHEDYATVYTAVQHYLSTNHYPPKIADIKSVIYGLKNKLPSGEEAWELVLKAGRNSAYHVTEERGKLPDFLQNLATVELLKSIASADNKDLTFIKKDFLENYKGFQESHKRDYQISSINNYIKTLGYTDQMRLKSSAIEEETDTEEDDEEIETEEDQEK